MTETDTDRYIREAHEAAKAVERACIDLLQSDFNPNAVEAGLLGYAVKAVVHRQGNAAAVRWLRETADAISEAPDEAPIIRH